MQFPENPTCHNSDWTARRFGPASWRGEAPYRSCSFCGSMHPEDLLWWLEREARLEGADWKYGWPHKFYISFSGPSKAVYEEVRARTPNNHVPIKWYNIHLQDEFDQETFDALAGALSRHSGITWGRDDEHGVFYKAPYRGYQQADPTARAEFKRIMRQQYEQAGLSQEDIDGLLGE